MEKTLILGMGNTIRGDDGVGIFISEVLRSQINYPDVEIKQTQESGIHLVDNIIGYEKVIIIDSLQAKEGRPGDIFRFNLLEENILSKSAKSAALYSLHHLGLAAIMEIAEALIDMPKEIIIYAVKTGKEDLFSDKLSPKVTRAITQVVNLIKKELKLLNTTLFREVPVT